MCRLPFAARPTHTCGLRPHTCASPPPCPRLGPTGFYDIVTKTEAERWEEHRAEREARARALQASIVEQFRARGREPPREVLAAAGLAASGSAGGGVASGSGGK